MSNVTLAYRADIEEHVVTVDGREVATAHKVGPAGMWSVKIGPKLLGLAPNESTALLHLGRYADKLHAES